LSIKRFFLIFKGKKEGLYSFSGFFLLGEIMNKSTTYADSGVNIELGDDVSKILYNAARQTWENRKGTLGELIVPFDDFSGVRAIDVSQLPKGSVMNMGFDGVGTKMELAERVGDHSTIAYDLFAMVCDDAVVRGAEPILIGSILDVNALAKDGKPFLDEVRQLAQGYVNAAKAANVAIVNGEVAEIGNRVGGYGSFNYNWGAAVVWFANRNRLFTGHEVRVGDYLVGFRERGFRSNGLSLVRKIMRDNLGDEWHTARLDGDSFAKLALEPSQIYCAAVVDMFGGFDGEPKVPLTGVAHITGGGIPCKLGRMLKPSGYGAVITNSFEPSLLTKYCQDKGNVSDVEAYRTWNMGQGMIVATPEPQAVISIAENYGIEAKIIGEVRQNPAITIHSNGIHTGGRYLSF
jgi:phosphoribosylformylglycinamidine cyclo-ligase